MAIQQGFPQVSAPFVDKNGFIDQSWLQLLISMWNRTGGGTGSLPQELVTPQQFVPSAGKGNDDTNAILQAEAFAFANNRALYLPGTPAGYLIKGVNLEIRVDLLGDGKGQTVIRHLPTSFADLDSCFVFPNQTRCWGITGSGPLVDTVTANLAAFVTDASLLPKYAAFAPGTAFFSTADPNGKVWFADCSTSRSKFGLVYGNATGNVRDDNCNWSGVFGKYCLNNGQNYVSYKSDCSGAFASILLSDFAAGGTGGGIQSVSVDCNDGFSPYCIYQAQVATVAPANCNGLFKCIRIGSGLERFGEAAIKLLPNSVTTGCNIDQWLMSWSPINTLYPANPDGATNLLPFILPYAEQQQYFAWFGGLSNSVFEMVDSFDTFVSPNSSHPAKGAFSIQVLGSLAGGVEHIERTNYLGLGATWDQYHSNKILSKDDNEYLYYQRGPYARKGDFTLDNRDPIKANNLLLDVSNPANVTIIGGSCTVSYPAPGTYPTLPAEVLQFVGDNPVVLQLTPLAGMAPAIKVSFQNPLTTDRPIALQLFWAGKSAAFPVEYSGFTFAFGQTHEGNGVTWQPVTGVQPGLTGGTYTDAQVRSNDNISPIYLVGWQVCLDDIQGYSRQHDPYTTRPFQVDQTLTVGASAGADQILLEPGVPGVVSPKIISTGDALLVATSGVNEVSFFFNLISRLVRFLPLLNSVNWLEFVTSVTTAPVSIRAAGADANVGLSLLAKGVELVRSGLWTTIGGATGTITANAQRMQIETVALATAALGSTTLVIDNNLVDNFSTIVVGKGGGSNTTLGWDIYAAPQAGGSIIVTIYNNNATTALNGTVKFGLTVESNAAG